MTLASAIQRRLEMAYTSMPWPQEIDRVGFVTYVNGGRGDIAAAAKVMKWLSEVWLEAQFEWVVVNCDFAIEAFVPATLQNRISVRKEEENREEPLLVDLLVLGPKKTEWSTEEVRDRFGVISRGAIFSFLEIAQPIDDCELADYEEWVKRERDYPLPMGLREGTGVFLNQTEAKGDLRRLTDNQLKETLLTIEEPFSFNFGYAHRAYSHAKFIDIVTLQESERSVAIVMPEKADFYQFSEQECADFFFHKERCERLKSLGYAKIVVKGAQSNVEIALMEEGRTLYLIIRAFFAPQDMREMQLAADRLLATGDNSAVESFEAGPQLYLYEDINKPDSCKKLFLQQQIDLAVAIYPPVGKLLKQVGTLHKEFNQGEWEELSAIISDSKLSEMTRKFCQTIVETYSFVDVAQGALKRHLWRALKPVLHAVERDILSQRWPLSSIEDRTYLAEKIKEVTEPLVCARIAKNS